MGWTPSSAAGNNGSGARSGGKSKKGSDDFVDGSQIMRKSTAATAGNAANNRKAGEVHRLSSKGSKDNPRHATSMLAKRKSTNTEMITNNSIVIVDGSSDEAGIAGA